MEQMLASVKSYISRFDDHEKIIEAMRKVDRACFVDKQDPYSDSAAPVGFGQTISQPSTVARMLQLADLQEGHEVLEVGGGSGWNACLISYLVHPGRVLSLERVPELAEMARKNLQTLGTCIDDASFIGILEFRTANIFALGDQEKFDRIIVTAGISPDQLERTKDIADRLLKEGGMMVVPYRSGPMLKIRRDGSIEETEEMYSFVPLVE